jgi:hypothetical protein
MTFQFPKPFFGGLFVGADAFDSESLAGMTCKNIQCTQKFSSTHTGEIFIIYCNANCKTENIIYLLECAICGLQYIGETKQQQ